ncbi:MAG: GNAT family N-acetyltransferase [Bacillota bacterium]
MIRLTPITEENFRAVIDMKLPEEPKVVAPNVVSLAQAWLYHDRARPFAVCDDDAVVGFLMLYWNEEEHEAGLWRLMIALEHQGRGYGTQAVRLAVDMVRASGLFDSLHVDYVPGNENARHIYAKLGFTETGMIDDGEIEMKLNFKE